MGGFTGCGIGAGSSANKNAAAVALESRGLGKASQELLRASPYSKLVIEVAAVPGFEPGSGTLDYLQAFLGKHLNKPGGIQIVTDAPMTPTGDGGLTTADLQTLEAANRTQFASGQTVAVYLMFLDNHNLGDTAQSNVLGLAYQSTSIAVFEGSLRSLAAGDALDLAEKTVISHEFGHIFGLVNFGVGMAGADHYDYQHSPGHCNNPNCLMNYSVHTDWVWNAYATAPPEFDAACLADLQSAGGN